jgi:uncharacterized C2H2 Zn-finger protein
MKCPFCSQVFESREKLGSHIWKSEDMATGSGPHQKIKIIDFILDVVEERNKKDLEI